jgi:hypothetical protein
MKQTDARITELLARLTALERERVEIVAEINTLRLVQSEGARLLRSSCREKPAIPSTGIRQSKRKLLCFAGFSAAAQMSSPSVGRIARRGGAATHPPARMNGSAGFAKNRESNVRRAQIRHSWS